MSFPRFRSTLLACLVLFAGLAAAAYPEKPIRLIVPYPAGGATDVMARGVAIHLGAELGQQVVVDNRGGAGGMVGAEAAARSAPDGYTLFFGTMGTQSINPALYPKIRYDPLKDFAPISLTHITPRVLVAGPSLKARNVTELIALAKRNPGTLTYGSAGNGSSSHLSGALFEALAGVDMVHVPYKGSSPLLVDLLAGRVDMTFDSYTVYEQHFKTGKVRLLGVTSKRRMDTLPQVPTIAEAGVPGYEVSNWLGLFAPAGTPKEILATLHSALGRAMANPGLREPMIALGIEPTFDTPEEFSALIRAETVKWAEIVKRSKVTAD